MTVRVPLDSVTSVVELCIPDSPPKIAFGPCSKEDLERVGANFYAAYSIAETHRFGYLLTAIDVADEEMYETSVKIAAIR